MGDGEGSEDLYSAFDRGLVEVRVTGQTVYPDWYLNVLAPKIRVPEELLDESEEAVMEHLSRFREDAHAAVWAILRREMYSLEISGQNRTRVVEFLSAGEGLEL